MGARQSKCVAARTLNSREKGQSRDMNSPNNDQETPEEYEGATEEEIDTHYAWEYRPEYEQTLEEVEDENE